MPDAAGLSVEVRHNAAAHRFEAMVNGLLCRAEYSLMGKVMAMHHTEVPHALSGLGQDRHGYAPPPVTASSTASAAARSSSANPTDLKTVI